MSTVATAQMRKLAADWGTKCGLKSAVMSGIVGDARHAKGGYHLSRADNPAGNYSIVRPEDRSGNGPNDAAAAIDMTMNSADMVLCTKRLIAAYSNTKDPRRKYLNAFNGWTGAGDAQRWDVYARSTSRATADHKWHVHLEIRRKYATSTTAMNAVFSILRGESVAVYLRSIGVVMTPVAAVRPLAPAYPGRLLRRNDGQIKPDASVKLFQKRMLERGWTSLGPADGYFGAKLESVVKRWQKVIGVSADGVIGPKTWPTPWTRPLGR